MHLSIDLKPTHFDDNWINVSKNSTKEQGSGHNSRGESKSLHIGRVEEKSKQGMVMLRSLSVFAAQTRVQNRKD